MERLELKQLQRLRQLKQIKQKQQMQIVKKMLQNEQVLTIFNYCKNMLMKPLTQSLSDYSPSHLSKFLFDEHLQKARVIFQSLPDQQCTIQHFLLIMISILSFPFQKWPYYLIGAKDMFNEIASEKAQMITYQSFFKYVIGQVLDFKEQQQNTEFQVRFEQLKKQDYLLHDNGVKKFYYSTDTKYYMTLDQSSPLIKLYNKQMRMVQKFTPNKQKHNKKYPNILHFDYNEMQSRLGIVLSDSTFSIINFHSFLTKSKYQFDNIQSNQIVISFDDKMLEVYYIQMINKWVLISDVNKMYTFDLQKYRQSDPQYLTQIKLENEDLKITYVLQLVNLSMICVVAGNQVYFFNQNFTQIKHSKFAHGTNIRNFRYCQELGYFLLSGDQKFITIVTLIKNSNNFQISTFDAQSKYQICTFDIFPIIGTIVTVDKNNQVRLFDIAQGTCYQVANYSNIVKKQHGSIKMFKISKAQFALYETYTLVFQQEKIAIEKDTQFSFLPRTYYEQAKQEFYISVNNQIISFSVPQGQIRKSFNLQTANVPKHESFAIGKETNLFIIDHQKNIYEAYLKDNLPDGENKNYKKKIGVSRMIQMFYDQQTRFSFVVGSATIHSIRNDRLNNFTVTSVLNIQNFPEIVAARYNMRFKYILAMTINQQFIVIDPQCYRLCQYYSFVFPIDPNQHEDKMIEQFDQDQQYNVDIILNNHNQIYLLSRDDPNNKAVIKIQDYLPYKLKNLKFLNMKYCQVNKNKRYLLLSDKTGYLIQLNITNIFSKNFKICQKQGKLFRFPVKDVHKLENNGQKVKSTYISGINVWNIDKKDITLFKAHQKQIKIMVKIYLQGIRTLTISVDGHIKLWQNQQMLFHLKLPDLKKMSWNMEKIQKIKNQRSVNQVVTVLNKISNLVSQKLSPKDILQKNLKLKASDQNKQIKRFNINEPIQIQIDNKDLQDFVYRTQNINWYTSRWQGKRRQKDLLRTQKTNHHPWRTKHQFRKIMDKASPENKYQKKMPRDLVNLRNSLDMKDRSSKLNKNYQGQLIILPQLNSYVPQNKNFSVKQKEVNQSQENENQEAFESCLYVKKKKDKKKINQFDEIDKQFKKKWLALTNKKYVPKSQSKKKNQGDLSARNKLKVSNQKTFNFTPINPAKYDAISEVKSIFQNYNRQASVNKKGRIIKIPQIKLKKEDLFNND